MSDYTMLKTLCGISAPTGREKALREYIQNALSEFVFRTDGCGSLILHKPGKGARVMVTAPMDEPTVMVLEGVEGQPAKIAPVGGALNALWGSRLTIDGRPGVVGITAVHLSKDSKDQYPGPDKLTMETGSREEQGGMGVFRPDFSVYGEDGEFVRCKAAACRSCVMALMKLAEADTDAELWLVFAAQNRLDGRGAVAAAAAIQPEIVICLEPMADSGINWEYDEETLILPLLDKGSIHDADLHAAAKKYCEDHKIKYKIPQKPEGSGASFAGRQAGGAKTLSIGLPSRYLNTPSESVRLCDTEAMAKLIEGLIKAEIS